MSPARYRFHVHRRLPAYRLVTREGAPFPAEGREADWDLTRIREADDVNEQVRGDVDRDGYSLFQIGLRLSDLPS